MNNDMPSGGNGPTEGQPQGPSGQPQGPSSGATPPNYSNFPNYPNFQSPGQPSAASSSASQYWNQPAGQQPSGAAQPPQPPSRTPQTPPSAPGQTPAWSGQAQTSPSAPQGPYGQVSGQPGFRALQGNQPPYDRFSAGRGAPPSMGQGGFTPPPATRNRNDLPLILGLVAVLVVVAIIAAFVLLRKNTPPTPQLPDPNPSVQTASGNTGEVVARSFGDPAAALGTTTQLTDYNGTGTINADQAEWVDNDGYADHDAYSYLAVRLNLACTEGTFEFSSGKLYFIGSDKGLYEASYHDVDGKEPHITSATLQQGNTFTGWVIVEAPKQAGTLVIASYDDDYPSVRIAIDGPQASPLKAMPHAIDNVTYNDKGFDLKITGYDLVDGPEYSRPSNNMRLLVLKTEWVASGNLNHGAVYSWAVNAFQNDEEMDSSYSCEEYYPVMTSFTIEKGDTVEGVVLQWVDPSKPIVIKYEPSTEFTDVELVTIQP